MLRIIIACIAGLIFVSCSRTPEEIQTQIKVLTNQERALKLSVTNLRGQFETLNAQVTPLREEVGILEHQKAGGSVEYIMVMGLRQVREGFSLDLDNMMKDEYNATKFEISVDKRTYNRYNEGDTFFKEFRKGSAMTEGSSSSWLIYVVEKRTILQ